MIDSEIARQTQLHEEKQQNAALARKAHQTDILRQVNERERTMRRDLQEKMFEERAAKLAEIDYSRKIQAEKNNNQEMLATWKHTVHGH